MTKLKICGITSSQDARLAVQAGAHYLGFVFCESPRRISPQEAAPIARELSGQVECVGVFKDVPRDEVIDCGRACPLQAVQLHGGYSIEDMREIRSALSLPLIRAVVPFEPEWSEVLPQCAEDCVDMLLLDPRGAVFDWRMTAEAQRFGKPVFLAGCLSPHNVSLAVALGRPYGVDVATGVEDSPGVKSAMLLSAFAGAVNGGSAAVMLGDNPAGRFGQYGGSYVPETLLPALEELAAGFDEARRDSSFADELAALLRDFAGRPTALFEARRLSAELGATLLLKREDLLHTGAHKINNCLGQALLARRMGKRRVIAETGAGQHGVATATVCALLGLECRVFMGEEDMRRQSPNVERMKLLGAELVPVSSGTRTLKDATSAAIREWVAAVRDTHYIIGSTVGPHPYPTLVREFQRVIGREARAQTLERYGRLPDCAIAAVGGGSNALGLFSDFLLDIEVALCGAEAAGEGIASGRHSASISAGRPGVLHGAASYLLQDAAGQVLPAHSISAGLDYPGVGPEHSFLCDVGRAQYSAVSDREALEAFALLARLEGIIPALESAHALALAARMAKERPGSLLLLSLSGRGDKDLSHALSEMARLAGLAEVAA